MKLIVGLGNPGKEYNNTRHNIGFMVLDNYLKDEKWQTKYNANYIEKNINNQKVIFIKPLTYMNLSGESIVKFVQFYKVHLDDILVIQDDLDLNVGKYRLKINSSSGGHNGIKSIIDALGSNGFCRLKIGISNDKGLDTKNYVLGKFNSTEIDIISQLYPIFNEIIEAFISQNIDKIMNKYNKKG